MRIRLARRAELFLPLALLAATALGRAAQVGTLLTAYMLMRLATLCAPEAFRRAAGGEASARRVRGAWTEALLATLALGLAAWRWGDRVWLWLFGEGVAGPRWTYLVATGAMMVLERLNEEHLRANGQGGSATLSAFLSAVLLAGALLCGGEIWWLGAAAVGLGVSILTGVGVGGNPFGPPRGATLVRLPGAVVRSLLYPLPGLLLMKGLARTDVMHATAGYLLGLAAYGCVAATYRRTREESAAPQLWLLPTAAALGVCASFAVAEARPVSLLFGFAVLAALLVNVAPGVRVLLASLATAAACAVPWLEEPLARLPGAARVPWLAAACAVLTALLLLPDLRVVARHRRAHRIQNKRSKT